MSEEMQGEAIEIAQEAMQKYNIEKDIAQHIKKTFDDRKGPTWHCIVGRNFGSFVTHGMATLLSDILQWRRNEVVLWHQKIDGKGGWASYSMMVKCFIVI